MQAGSVRIRITRWWNELAQEQRVSFIVMFFCSMLAIAFAGLHLRSLVYEPFFVSREKLEQRKKIVSAGEQEAKRLEELKQKDTDRDGLSDYQELYQYRTSAYLSDSDSDRIPDAIEVARGTSPICPEGKTCGDTSDPATVSPSASSTANGLLGVTQPSLGSEGIESSGDTTGSSTIPFPSQATPGQIRSYLLSNRVVSDEQLQALSDQELLETYARAFVEADRIRAEKSR